MLDAQALRAQLRADLVAAMKAREPHAVAALRTAIAAVDNAEAIEASDRTIEPTNEHVAGAGTGAGSTEAERRILSSDELLTILRAQITERATEADRYDSLGQHDAADRLRREADVLRKYLAP